MPRANCNLEMAFGMNCYLIIALVASQALCRTASIQRQGQVPGMRNNIPKAIFRISNNDEDDLKQDLPSSSQRGSKCVEKDRYLTITILTGKDLDKSSMFSVAVNSEAYTESRAKHDVMFSNMSDKFCILWGTWMPSDTNENIKIYFQIFTNEGYFRTVFLLNFDIDYDQDILKTDILLSSFSGLKLAENERF